MAEAFGLPLNIDTGQGVSISPIASLVVVKGMDQDGSICYAVALSDDLDIMDALALIHYGRIDIENRVKTLVAPE